MKQFPTIQKLDLGILYALELTSSISVLLLAFGLIASMANVLTKGSVLSDSSFMQGVYAWSQCIGIDASIPGAIMRTLYYYRQREWGNAGAYTLLSMLLLFTAMIVSSIESIQQTLNITLSSAYAHVFIPIEGLIWIRSITVVLLVVVHAVKHVQREPQEVALTIPQVPEETNVAEEQPKQITAPKGRKSDGLERVKAYLVDYPNAKSKEVSLALSMSLPTAIKWLAKARSV
jgi:hypothetical protein